VRVQAVSAAEELLPPAGPKPLLLWRSTTTTSTPDVDKMYGKASAVYMKEAGQVCGRLCAAGTDVWRSHNTSAGDPVHADSAGKGTNKAYGDREVSAVHLSTETTCQGA
jgi:hypothetical protein